LKSISSGRVWTVRPLCQESAPGGQNRAGDAWADAPGRSWPPSAAWGGPGAQTGQEPTGARTRSVRNIRNRTGEDLRTPPASSRAPAEPGAAGWFSLRLHGGSRLTMTSER